MKFTLRFASDWDYEKEIIIHSLEDLEALQTRYGYALVVNFVSKEIMVYDDYIE